MVIESETTFLCKQLIAEPLQVPERHIRPFDRKLVEFKKFPEN